MTSTTERDAQREDLRERIVEAARDIVSEEGLDALSMRAPGTIYHHFRDKEELLRSVMAEGHRRLAASVEAELAKLGEEVGPLGRYAAMGRGYARFALENTGYFRSMFKMPKVAYLEGCPERVERVPGVPSELSRSHGAELLRRASEAGEADVGDPSRAELVGWGLIHGLTSLYLSGHLQGQVNSHEEFMDLIESAIEAIGRGWLPRP